MMMLLYSVQIIRARLFKATAATLLLAVAACAQNTAQPLAEAVRAHEDGKFDVAAARLQSLHLAKLADYVSYYRGASRARMGQHAEARKDFEAVRAFAPRSPLFPRAVVREAECLVALGKSAEAVQLIQQHYAMLPQPDADLAVATAYEAGADNLRATEYYQRVYYSYPAGEAAMTAAAALLGLRSSLGSSFPAATAEASLRRIDKLIAIREFSKARSELEDFASQSGDAGRNIARVRLGALDYARGNTREAYQYLKALQLPDGGADAERLFYLAECARRAGDDDEMLDHIKRLGKKYEFSPWRLKALVAAANRFLVANNQDRYEDLYRAAYEAFPETTEGAYAHWKVAWLHYLKRKRDADDRLRTQLERFPSYNATAAAYFLGRQAEAEDKFADARAYYNAIVQSYPHYYYGVMARERLRQAQVVRATPSPKIQQFLDKAGAFRTEREAVGEATAATRSRLARARLLAAAGLSDLAEAELRFGSREDAQPVFMAIERARMESVSFDALRAIKRMAPAYLSMELNEAPKDFWQYLFPLPYRSHLLKHAQTHDLDAFMVAALIRQESEFNPRARSRVNALGLTQVMPGTGRQLARRVGFHRFSTSMLYEPEPNLRIGTYYLRTLLDRWAGKWEETLAAYNAGPSRAVDWVTWGDYREPAEFVETVPFTETREYIQAVVRNAALYRQIYQDGFPAETKVAEAASKKPAATASVRKKAPAKKTTSTAARKKTTSKARSASKTTVKKKSNASARKKKTSSTGNQTAQGSARRGSPG